MYKQVYLNRGKEESLLRFHPWIFSGAINRIDEGLEEGDIVRVMTHDNRFIAVGHFQIGSIAVRVLSFHDVKIDDEFWESRLSAALQVRNAIGVIRQSGDAKEGYPNTTYRLVHGEGDNLPGLVIDIYGTTAVMQAHSVGMHVCREVIARALVKVMGDQLDSIYYKSETTLPFKADLGQENGFIYGQTDNNIAIENGLKFHIDWLKGQKTGFFIDQRENRSLLEYYAQGRSVLNMFCYTGGFSVYAMRGGAKCVHSVDSSAKAIELTNKNVALNFPEDTRHAAFCEDAFKYLDDNEGKSQLSTWLYRIAINEALDCLRRKRSKVVTEGEDTLHLADSLLADEYFDGDRGQALLQEAIATLPDVQRMVFTLRYFDEMKYSDMSELLGTSVGALKASYHIAVEKVTTYMKQYE